MGSCRPNGSGVRHAVKSTCGQVTSACVRAQSRGAGRAGTPDLFFFFFFRSFLSDRLVRLTGSRLSLPTEHRLQMSMRAWV